MSGAINLLARNYRVEVSTDDTNYVRFFGVNDFDPNFSPNTVDATDYESDGWQSFEITMQAWKVTIKANRKATGGVEDPAFTLVRACQGQFGDAARLYVRWYRKDGLPEAWKGRAIVEATKSKTNVPDLDEWSVVFTGDGPPTRIANPYSPAVAPVVIAATPSGATAGSQVTITGTNFTGTVATTGVKFGAVNASSWVVLGDSTIVAIVPAGAAGSAPIKVTNATGASTDFPYTRGA